MDFKFFRVVRIIGLVGIKLNLTIQLSYHASSKCINLSLKLYVMRKWLMLTTGRFSLRRMETTKPRMTTPPPPETKKHHFSPL